MCLIDPVIKVWSVDLALPEDAKKMIGHIIATNTIPEEHLSIMLNMDDVYITRPCRRQHIGTYHPPYMRLGPGGFIFMEAVRQNGEHTHKGIYFNTIYSHWGKHPPLNL